VVVKKEVKKGCCRFDFLLQKGSLEIFLEVKSCTLFTDKVAMFPDAPTSRGRRHVDELARISNNKTKGAILFLINSFETEVFLPDYHTDLNFVQSLYSARGKIMIIPLAIRWHEDLSLASKIKLLKVPWKVLEREAKDGGSYLVVLRLSQRKSVEIGALGKINFKRGYYIYVGSAKKIC
jgi:sugar fermentation stimulation protein A